MNKHLILFGSILIFCVFFNSCKEPKKTRFYNLYIELNEPIPNLKESDLLPDYLKVFINYTDTSSSNELLVPDVTFIRTDIKSANSFKLEPPLTWINKFRKRIGMLPSEYIKEDYNGLVDKLLTPKILTEEKGKVVDSTKVSDNEENIFSLNIYKVNPDSVKALKDKITRKLCGSKGNITIRLRIINKKDSSIKDSSINKLLVTTTDATNITATVVVLGGNVTNDGNATVTERGVCYSTSQNPTTGNRKLAIGTGTGVFSNTITGLIPKTTYYARAYANNSKGTAYGSQVTFRTNIENPVVIDHQVVHEDGRKIITANSLEEYFQKIGDPSIYYDLKGNLKASVIEKYFAGENSLVVAIGINGTEVSHTKVKVFIEDLSSRNFKFKVLDKKTNTDQKITTLNIKEL